MYSAFWKDPKAAEHRNVYLPFTMGALLSDGKHPNTQTELTRRILGFQNFNVEPAPISDLTADTTTSSIEGTVTLRWTAVSDDVLGERASKYLLKIREYDPARIDSGKFTSEKACVDSGFAYYQVWTPAVVGNSEAKAVNLAPGKSYVFAVKAGDESTPTRWSALGAEPMNQTRGDTLTPHYMSFVGSASNGYVNHFANTELIDIDNGDTLYFTWALSNIFFGYRRCNWTTSGDLFIYLDTKSGGTDSTIGDWNGATADTAALFDTGGDFKPDFCFVLDNFGDRCKLMYWTGTAWAESIAAYPTYDGLKGYSVDTIFDTYHTEIWIPNNKIGYSRTNPFKFMALNLSESTERCNASFPHQNPSGTKEAKAVSRYPYYFFADSLGSNKIPRNVMTSLAVELTEFSALESGSGVTLSWRTESETDNYQWLIERSTTPDDGYQRIGAVPGQGTSPTGHSYSFTDNSVLPGYTYFYMLGDQDFNENVTWHGPVSVTTGGPAIDRVALGPCVPNPVRGAATISFQIPMAAVISLKIFDINGRQVRILADGAHLPGRHRAAWDGTDGRGKAVASGVYFYRLEAGGTSLTGKLTYIR
jgi:hypothetical protein